MTRSFIRREFDPGACRLSAWLGFAVAVAVVLIAAISAPARAERAGSGASDVLAASAAAPRPPAPPAERTPATLPEGMHEKLAAFVAALWADAEKRGVARALFESAFAGLEPDAEIFNLLANQPEHVAAPWDYMNRLASDKRIEAGRQLLVQHADLLGRIEAKYAVDKRVVLAIWGVESNFGAGPGNRHVIRSLATLSVGDARRPEFWRAELLTALAILQRGDITLERMTGSWAGAMGHTQFMPTSYMAYAVDFDGDGRRDIWGSVADALASTANYLKVSGWQPGEPWGVEVVLPAGFDYSHTRPGISKPLSAWQALGITAPSGRTLPPSALGFNLVLPAGARGPVFLVSQNFKAILKYNNSNAYALAVGHLGDRIGGADPVSALWPTDDPPLSRQGREELQRNLSALGHGVGPADGLLGTGTRAAVRAAQQHLGLPEDGYASERLLRQLLEQSKQ